MRFLTLTCGNTRIIMGLVSIYYEIMIKCICNLFITTKLKIRYNNEIENNIEIVQYCRLK